MAKVKSIRLTNDEKNHIISKILAESKTAKAVEEYKKKEYELFIKVRDYSLGKDKEAYLSLSANLQKFDTDIAIQNMPGNPSYGYAYIRAEKRSPCPIGYYQFSNLSKSLQKQVETFVHKKFDLKKEHEKYAQIVKSIIASANTTKQLLDTLPEADKYFSEDLKYKLAYGNSNNLPIVSNEVIKTFRQGLVKSQDKKDNV